MSARLRSPLVLVALALVVAQRNAVGLPLELRVAVVWTYLVFSPGWALRVCRLVPDLEPVGRISLVALFSLVWNVAVLFVFNGMHVGLEPGFWLLVASPVVLGLVGDFLAVRGRGWRETVVDLPALLILLGVLLTVGVRVGAEPAQVRLDSDIPAHVGAIRDADLQDRWLPLDRSFPGSAEARDPRMGALHGLHAAVAGFLGADPGRVWVRAAGVLSSFFIVAFAFLFMQLGLSTTWSLLVSGLFAAGSWHGRPLGTWAAMYPAQTALAMGAISWGLLLKSLRLREEGQKGVWGWWLGAGALGLSVLVHPFAWWAFTLVMAHMVILFLVFRRITEAMHTFLFAAVSFALGFVLLLPALGSSEGAHSGAHWEPAGVLYFTSSLFTLDPLVVLRWSGWLAPLSVVMAFLLWRRWGAGWRSVAVMGASLPMWTIALDPLVQPTVYAHVGYLSERLGLVAMAPALLVLLFVDRWQGRPGVGRRAAATVVLLILAWGALPGWSHSPYRLHDGTSRYLKALEQCDLDGGETVLADPVSSYALRASSSSVPVLLPVAHASPLDATIVGRLATYRSLLSSDTNLDDVRRLLSMCSASQVLVCKRVESIYDHPEYGFVPVDSLQARLAERLQRLGVEARFDGPGFVLYDLRSWRRSMVGGRAPVGWKNAEEVDGAVLALESWHCRETEVAIGDTLHVEALFKGCGTAVGKWRTVELGMVKNGPTGPAVLEPVSKLYRKLIVQRQWTSRDRILFRWIPGDGYRCGEESWHDERSLVIPRFLEEGEYKVFARLVASPWRPNRSLREYLDDRVRWGAKGRSSLTLVKREEVAR